MVGQLLYRLRIQITGQKVTPSTSLGWAVIKATGNKEIKCTANSRTNVRVVISNRVGIVTMPMTGIARTIVIPNISAVSATVLR